MRNLNPMSALSVCEVILDAIDEAGYPPEEAIPGCVEAIAQLASALPRPDVALDEAASLLSDVEV